MDELKESEIWIDGFNQIITLEVLLNDSVLLNCMDGCIRDLASLRGTYRLIEETSGAIRLLFDILSKYDVQKANILLDEPVSNSGRLKLLIAEVGEEYSILLDIRIIKDVDKELYQKENVITSDSIVLDNCVSWINVLPACLKAAGKEPLKVW